MPLKLYKIDASAPCRSVYMVAEILNREYETQEVNILVGDHLKPEYLEKNPLHLVPLLEDRDFLLADSHAIITYLVSKYGADKNGELYPSDLATRATIDQRLYFDATVLFPAVAQIVGEILGQKLPGPSGKKISAAKEAYAVLEKYLEKSAYVAGENLTIADISLVATVSTLATLISVDDSFRKVKAWLNKLNDQDKETFVDSRHSRNYLKMQWNRIKSDRIKRER